MLPAAAKHNNIFSVIDFFVFWFLVTALFISFDTAETEGDFFFVLLTLCWLYVVMRDKQSPTAN